MSETRKLVCDQLCPLNRDGFLGLDLDETGVGDGDVVAGWGDGDDLLGPGPVVQLDHGPVRRRVGEVVRGLAVLGEGVLGDGGGPGVWSASPPLPSL